jgi:hypothetical protein
MSCIHVVTGGVLEGYVQCVGLSNHYPLHGSLYALDACL